MSVDIFAGSQRLQSLRRVVGHLERYRQLMQISTDVKDRTRVIVTLDQDIGTISEMIRANQIEPLDTPIPYDDELKQEQPLCPPGTEQFMSEFVSQLLKEETP